MYRRMVLEIKYNSDKYDDKKYYPEHKPEVRYFIPNLLEFADLFFHVCYC